MAEELFYCKGSASAEKRWSYLCCLNAAFRPCVKLLRKMYSEVWHKDAFCIKHNLQQKISARERQIEHTCIHSPFIDLLLLNCCLAAVLQFNLGGSSEGHPEGPNRPSYRSTLSFTFNDGTALGGCFSRLVVAHGNQTLAPSWGGREGAEEQGNGSSRVCLVDAKHPNIPVAKTVWP